MMNLRKAEVRGHFDFGWLNTYHSFSFGDYHDPEHMGFRSLRVINEDVVQPGQGFGTHPHRDMEIITYVLEGALAHKDSMGNGSTILPGEVQRMTAGTGVTHSEFNKSPKETVHLLQIWILPEKKGLTPGYEQKTYTEAQKNGKLLLVASRDGRDGSVTIHQDVNLYASVLDAGGKISAPLRPGRHAWVQVARGQLTVNGKPLGAGDGASISEETSLDFEAKSPTEFLFFDLN